MTSQLFANVYLDAFDHFIKENLHIRHYLRYTDDMVIVGPNKQELVQLLPAIQSWFWDNRRLTLHPNKIILRKLERGIDFLGYITLPHYRVLRTRTKKRMLVRASVQNLPSYLGLLQNCSARNLGNRMICRMIHPRRV